jgi:AcrR family transcriptional regulator
VEVFCEVGFAGASIAAIVERAGSSVGSVYHHFGGKAELSLAEWERTLAVTSAPPPPKPKRRASKTLSPC